MEAILKGKCAKNMPVCGLYAVAYLAKIPLDEVFDYIKKKNKRANNWKGYQKFADRELAFKKFLKLEKFKTERQSLRNFIYDTSHINKTFLVRTTGHIQVIEKGKIIDQKGTFYPSDYLGINKRVVEVFIFKGAKS